jgi:hypothetical protein
MAGRSLGIEEGGRWLSLKRHYTGDRSEPMSRKGNRTDSAGDIRRRADQ